MKKDNELCTGLEAIDTMDECKVANGILGYSFDGEESDSGFPKGCYMNAEAAGGPETYWNNHPSGGEDASSYSICKKGENIE